MTIELDDLSDSPLFPSPLPQPAEQPYRATFFQLPTHLTLANREIIRFGKSSSIFQTSGNSFPPDRRIGVLCGIDNLPEQALAHAERISGYAQGHRIEGIDNSTHSPLIDLVETLFLNYQGIPTIPSHLCQILWASFHKENAQNPNAKYLQICHSQGAVHVKNALLYSPPEIRSRIIVLALAPAAIIPKSLCYNSYNYAIKRDLVPYGEISSSILFNPIKAIQDFEHLKELSWFDPVPNAPHPHHFDNPIFAALAQHHIKQYMAT